MADFGIAYFASYLFAAVVHGGSDVAQVEFLFELVGVVDVFLRYGQYGNLCGCEPEGEVSCGMLYKNGYEALHAAEGGCVR